MIVKNMWSTIDLKYKLMVICLTIGIFYFVTGLFWVIPISKDATFYAMLIHGHFPPDVCLIYPPLFIWISQLLHCSGLDAYTSGYIVGSLFYIITVIPLYLLLRFYLSDIWSILGCLLYLIHPQIVQWCNIGILESGKGFFIILSLFLFVSYSKKKFRYKLVLLGCSLGLLAMSRQDGIFFSPIFVIMLGVMSFFDEKSKKVIRKLFALLVNTSIVVIFALIVITPRSLQVYERSGIFAPTLKQAGRGIKLYQALGRTFN